jgi:hypothetical protein
VPDIAIKNFFSLFSARSDLTKKEKALWQLLLKKINFNNKFYVIATFNDEDINHEVAHGFYYLDAEYCRNMTDLYNKYKTSNFIINLNKHLLKIGYRKEVLIDETQAYVSTESFNESFNYKRNKVNKKIISEFKHIFESKLKCE